MTPGPSDWLAAGARPGRPAPSLGRLSRRLSDLGWRRIPGSPAVWVSAEAGLPVRRFAWGVLIGRYHPAPPPMAADVTPRVAAERLVSGGWGRWIALLARPDAITAIRDPSGALDAFLWRRGPVWAAASDAHPGLDGLLPVEALVDLPQVRAMLAHAAAVCGASALRGVHACAPGGGLVLPGDGAPEVFQTWTPARAAATSADPDALRPTVDAAVRVLLAPHARCLGEISGGFDSAVTATSAAAQGLDPSVAAWLNFHSVEPEGDERSWARAVAETAGLTLAEIRKRPAALGLADLEPLARGLRPALQGLDVEYDASVAAALRAQGAGGLLTGQGGDAVFLQFASPALAADRLRRLGLRGLAPRYLHQTARHTRRSAWRIAGTALRDRLGLAPARDPEAADPAGPEIHPWLADLTELPPARRGQIRQLTNAQIFHGDCLRARAAELLHPLLTQPVMEVCLGLPTDVLAEDGRDRALARARFADRLPPGLLARRGKGELSAYYGRVVSLSLPLARELLLDGELLRLGLIDRRQTEADLDPDRLMADGAYNLVLIRMVLELWLRGWRARLAARREPLIEPGEDARV